MLSEHIEVTCDREISSIVSVRGLVLDHSEADATHQHSAYIKRKGLTLVYGCRDIDLLSENEMADQIAPFAQRV